MQFLNVNADATLQHTVGTVYSALNDVTGLLENVPVSVPDMISQKFPLCVSIIRYTPTHLGVSFPKYNSLTFFNLITVL